MRLRVGLAGCGVVGGALLEHLAGDGAISIERVLVRDPARRRSVALPPERWTTDPDDLLAADVDVIVELVGGLRPALRLARGALDTGRAFVTANKALLAEHGVELEARARAAGAVLLFDGAVGGGVPMLRTLDAVRNDLDVRGLAGILNGTCNHVLSEMAGGVTLAAALEGARERGYVEADPARDLDGRDAEDKIRILAWRAWGVDPAAVEVAVRGIETEADALVASARRRGREIRLLASARRDPGGRIRARVEPVEVAPGSPWGRTRGVLNRLEIHTHAGSWACSGPGAGGRVTAAAVGADLRSLTRPTYRPHPPNPE